jgi:hypothetical protein
VEEKLKWTRASLSYLKVCKCRRKYEKREAFANTENMLVTWILVFRAITTFGIVGRCKRSGGI